jgi:diguanylate cyclase (GGDEF)-like protein
MCERLGLDAAERERRLAWHRLSEEDHALAQRLQNEVIRPNLTQIVKDFYGAMTKQREFWALVGTREKLLGLERHQRQYLQTLGVDFDTEGYFETRLRVGQAHARIGMPLWLYHGAYATMTLAILERTRDLPGAWELASFAHRILGLDQSLATEVYHRAQMKDLEREIEQVKARESVQVEQARRDSLTGVLRRETVMDMLEKGVARARERNEPMSLLLADVDEFKSVNDRFGHLVGDDVLSAFASRLTGAVRAVDAIGRYGGEEFLIVLHDTRLEKAVEIAERARMKIDESPFESRGRRMPITVSLGVAELAPGESPIDVLARADVALYRAKREGRNRVIGSPTPGPGESATEGSGSGWGSGMAS